MIKNTAWKGTEILLKIIALKVVEYGEKSVFQKTGKSLSWSQILRRATGEIVLGNEEQYRVRGIYNKERLRQNEGLNGSLHPWINS